MSGEADRAGSGWSPARRVTLEGSRRGYRAVAPVYDAVFGRLLNHGRRVGIAALDCRPGERVLELCIGSGLSLPLYAEGTQVTGVDLSADMLVRASARLAQMRPGAGCTLLQMNAERLAFADGSFDKAAVLFGVAGLPDPVLALRELRRVCRPGATIVLVNRFRSDELLARALDLALSPVYRLLRYRVDLDGAELVRQSGLEVIGATPVNLMGYATAFLCRRPIVTAATVSAAAFHAAMVARGEASVRTGPHASGAEVSVSRKPGQADSTGPASMPS